MYCCNHCTIKRNGISITTVCINEKDVDTHKRTSACGGKKDATNHKIQRWDRSEKSNALP